MLSLGSKQRPIIVKVKTTDKRNKIGEICDHFGWQLIAGLEYDEDLTDLRKALQERLSPASVYEPCPCGSGNKFRFCCGKKMKNFNVNQYIEDFRK